MRAIPCLPRLAPAICLIPLCLGPAYGADSTPGPGAPQLAHNCKCLAADHAYAQGAIACIKGKRLKCGMSQNVSSWLVLEGTCTPSRVSLRTDRPLRPALLGATHFTPM